MIGQNPSAKDPIPDEGEVERKPDEADEEQLDEAIEETFPASDPISP